MEEVNNQELNKQAEDFNELLQEVSKVFQKYNPPVQIAISAIFHIVSEVAQRQNIPKENLMNALSEIYESVKVMLEEVNKTETPANELQH